MTERRKEALGQSHTTLRIGPSALVWNGATLAVRIDEITAPFPSRLAGVVKIHANTINETVFPLDEDGHHRWRPIAPSARVEVELTHPQLRFSGAGYLDTNMGDSPLTGAFSRWSWSRAVLGDDRTAVLYETNSRTAPPKSMFLEFDPHRGVTPLEPPASVTLPKTNWGIARECRAEGGDVRVVKTLENTPFYARSVLDARWNGARSQVIHESLSLDRFDALWVQMMLPFRMPRALR